MAVFKCKMCGGNLEITDGISVAVCEYCGTKQTVSTTKDEVIANLLNRANNLRLKCEFDKAEQVYEKVLDIDNTDSEAHWGIVLCKYGIEYVEDTKTYTRIPTCHRTLYEAVLTDVDYLATIENANAEQKELYIAEAKNIDELQKNILTIVNSEEPFDVFICYKETDENGKRTVDSAIANDIYYQLTQEGFKVFYAPITLEDKLGQEYEPYIFSALNSAKVMLVVGTKPEYFDSVWVRNEWSRFFKSMKNDRSKMLIPCYRDMDAYELPDEFAHLQAQDMGKIGFISDVIRGLKKVFNREEEPQYKPVRNKRVRPKRPNKFKLLWEKVKNKFKREKVNYHLSFPAPKLASAFFAFTLIFYIYFLIKSAYSEWWSLFAIAFGLPLINLFLIFRRVWKKKKTALIIQGLSMSVILVLVLLDAIFSGDVISPQVKYGIFLQTFILANLFFIWFICLCFSRKTENGETIAVKLPLKISFAVVSVIAVLGFEFGCVNFCDYYFAKTFYNVGWHQLATDYFLTLEHYKDSHEMAICSTLKDINNTRVAGFVYMDACTGKKYDQWHVIAKEDDRVLLLSDTSFSKPALVSIQGGWPNSSLRTYLNGEYFENTFDERLKERILSTELENSLRPVDKTIDKIFILSKDEIETYLPDKSDRYWTLSDSMLRDKSGDLYTAYYGDEFYQFKYQNGEFEFLDTPSEASNSVRLRYVRAVDRGGVKRIFDNQFYPAMWIDITGIDD